MTGSFGTRQRLKAPSDEGDVSKADWGREKREFATYFSPSGPSGTSLIRGRQGAVSASTTER